MGKAHITESEIRVMEQINNGLTHQEAAKVLFLSYHTVRSHTARVRRRLKVKDTAEAVGILREVGILEDRGCVCRSATSGRVQAVLVPGRRDLVLRAR